MDPAGLEVLPFSDLNGPKHHSPALWRRGKEVAPSSPTSGCSIRCLSLTREACPLCALMHACPARARIQRPGTVPWTPRLKSARKCATVPSGGAAAAGGGMPAVGAALCPAAASRVCSPVHSLSGPSTPPPPPALSARSTQRRDAMAMFVNSHLHELAVDEALLVLRSLAADSAEEKWGRLPAPVKTAVTKVCRQPLRRA